MRDTDWFERIDGYKACHWMTYPSDLEMMLCTVSARKDGAMLFGMGGGLLQNVSRDDYGFVMKPTLVKRGGHYYPVCKETAGKQSRAGISLQRADEVSPDNYSDFFESPMRWLGVMYDEAKI